MKIKKKCFNFLKNPINSQDSGPMFIQYVEAQDKYYYTETIILHVNPNIDMYRTNIIFSWADQTSPRFAI